MRPMRKVDVVIVGASLSAAAAAKRLVDAGLETVVLERKALPRHKICSGILSPRLNPTPTICWPSRAWLQV